MKRYLSVFGLAARSSFWQGLALMIVSVALAGALLYLTPGLSLIHILFFYREVEGEWSGQPVAEILLRMPSYYLTNGYGIVAVSYTHLDVYKRQL